MITRALVAAGLALFAGSSAARPPAAPAVLASVSADARKAVIRRYIAIWESGRSDRLGAVIAPGYTGHGAAGDRDVAGLRARIAAFRAAYPGMRFTIHDQLVDGDRVATRMSAAGTSAKTGQRVRLVGINLSRFAGNRIVEEWPVWETATGAP